MKITDRNKIYKGQYLLEYYRGVLGAVLRATGEDRFAEVIVNIGHSYEERGEITRIAYTNMWQYEEITEEEALIYAMSSPEV